MKMFPGNLKITEPVKHSVTKNVTKSENFMTRINIITDVKKDFFSMPLSLLVYGSSRVSLSYLFLSSGPEEKYSIPIEQCKEKALHAAVFKFSIIMCKRKHSRCPG